MRLAALLSGGKDSVFAIHRAKQMGHQVVCLITLFPQSEESMLLHHPNMKWTSLQSKSMGIPQMSEQIPSNDLYDELQTINKLLVRAIDEYDIDGILHGGMQSNFQRKIFEKLASDLNIKVIKPLWNIEPVLYMQSLLDEKFKFIISSVSADGLDDIWLGKIIDTESLKHLSLLSKKFGFNINFEGGEAETFVTDCPLFEHPIYVLKYKKFWDGYRGRFEIEEAELKNNA